MKKNNYYLGLDIGTNSCGYAVTDEHYKLLKYRGQKMWGVNLFSDALTAEKRREKRCNRRRLDRRKLRLEWLREIFRPQIEQIDKNMLDRMKYSNLWWKEGDKIKANKALSGKGSLFDDVNELNDKSYFSNYPTIFHLREKLIKEPADDVRLLYLALHNIVKRRGHFLLESEFGGNSEVSLKTQISNFFNLLKSTDCSNFYGEDEFVFDCIKSVSIDDETEHKLISLIKSNISKRDLKKEVSKLFVDTSASKAFDAIIEGFVNGTIKTNALFCAEEDAKIVFDSDDFENKIKDAGLNEEQETIVYEIKSIYSELQLRKILGDKKYICEAMVAIYEKHQIQLAQFKSFIKKYFPDKKELMFRLEKPVMNFQKSDDKKATKQIVNYPLYVCGTIYNNEKRVIDTISDRKKGFYDFVKLVVNGQPSVDVNSDANFEQTKAEILSSIENDNFLPLLRTRANGLYPNKLYVKEVKKILEVNKNKFTFLNDVDETGLSNEEKILQILSYKVPYYVGPISFGESKNKWAERKGNEPLKPWNLFKIIDKEQCERDFIIRMTNKCRYLQNEDVLPKHSLLYSKYRVLNELNNLTINGNGIGVELKQRIYNELFKIRKKITEKALKTFLINKCQDLLPFDSGSEIQIGGIDKDFANELASYHYLINCGFTDKFINENEEIFEQILFWQTILSDKNRLVEKIKLSYGNVFSEEEIKKLKGLNFAGWGNFSRKFLEQFVFVSKSNITGEEYDTTIINELYNTNKNLMQIIYDSTYTLNEQLALYNNKIKKEITREDVDNMYCSPSVKRGIWQTLKVIKEIEEIMGGKPSKIFVEVTRENKTKGEDGRKDSRFNTLQAKYKDNAIFNFDGIDAEELKKELSGEGNKELRGERLYLYYTQLGKDMYTGEKIDIRDLTNDNKYDVDHIIPQALIKDDSIDNKVLVKKNINAEKSDSYPLPIQLRGEKQKALWLHLLKSKLISKEKYQRLIRTTALTEAEQDDFVNRQIVETSQSSKAVIDLLKSLDNGDCEKTEIIYSKAKVVSDFRQLFGISKSRIVNDFHHAKDAYLNIVVGNIINERFGYIRGYYKQKENKNKHLTRNLIKLFTDVIVNHKGEVIWDLDEMLPQIQKTCIENSPVVSKRSFFSTNGMFYDESVYKAKRNDSKSVGKIPLKGKGPLSDVERYGGYNKEGIGYFMLIESDENNGRKRTIESVPVYLYQTFANDPAIKGKTDKEKQAFINDNIFKYICKENKLSNAKIVLSRINTQSTLQIGDGEFWLAAKTGNKYTVDNANEWFVDNDYCFQYVKYNTSYKNQEPHYTEYNKLVLPTTEYVKKLEKYEKNAKLYEKTEEKNDELILSRAFNENGKDVKLSKIENIDLYEKLIAQFSKKMYSDLNIGNVADKLIIGKELFINLSVRDQATVLINILHRLSTGNNSADLSKIKQVKNAGICTINKNITGKGIKLIIRSATGLKQKVIDLDVI